MADSALMDGHGRKVGITKGPGETIHEYTFVSRDPDQVLKNGEFVYYELEVGGMRRVLGRILKRVPLKLYPDSFMAEPEVPPAQVAALVGYDVLANELFELHVAIMGYYEEGLGSFVNPWIPPQSGLPIYLAGDAMLGAVLSKKRGGQTGSAHIGSLLTRAVGAVPVILDVKELVSTHLAIIASTGAGKSYLASVIIEELMRPYNKACVLIVDPHGEYSTLEEIANREEFCSGNGRGGYRARVGVYRPEDIKVKVSSLTLGDLRYLLGDLSEKMHYILGRAFNKVTRDRNKGEGRWTVADLKGAIVESAKDDGEDESGTARALSWRIGNRFESNFTFDDFRNLDLNAMFKPGQCTVLQLNEIDERDQQVIVATLLRRLYKARMDTDRGKAQQGSELYLPYPVFVLLEEAHHFAPAASESVSTGILKQVLAEGRKFGIGIGLISQRPGKLNPDVLSQCLTQFVMRIVNEVDQKSVAAAVEGVGRDLLQTLPALSKGQVIVAGSGVNTPMICRVRERLTRHGGQSHDAPKLWQNYFSTEHDKARRESAPLQRSADPFSIYK